jgi:nucleoside-diphosphate-sugar epimerase
VVRTARQAGMQIIAAPRSLPDRRELVDLISKSDAIINCVGVTRPEADLPERQLETFHVNVLFPCLIAMEADRQNKVTVHLSSSIVGQSLRPMSPTASNEFHNCTSSSTLRDRLISAWSKSRNEQSGLYVASKRLLEGIVIASKYSVAVRITNVYGPQLIRQRLLPRLIRARILGHHFSRPDEPRNYFTEAELGRLLLLCATQAETLGERILDVFGSTNTTVRELANAVERSLPTSYGEFDIVGTCESPRCDSTLGRYFPSVDNPIPGILEGVHETVRSWRRKISCSDSDIIRIVEPVLDKDRGLLGGSIARKQLMLGPQGTRYILKHSNVSGFEGAAGPKLQAEANFYSWLVESKRTDLLRLYVEPLERGGTGGGHFVATVYTADGCTIADAIQSFPRPRSAMRQIVADLYASSYLRDLVVLPPEERCFQLSVLYLDRAADRLTGFLQLLCKGAFAPRAVVAMAQELLAGTTFEIDGQEVENPLIALRHLSGASATERLKYAPAHAGTCGHGDLTILNMLWMDETNKVLLIDPRGLIGPLDPIYDLGKLLFSLSGFGLLMRNGIKWEPLSTWRHRLSSSDSRSFGRCMDEHAATLDWIVCDPHFAPLRTQDGSIRLQLLLAEATHYLADVPFRFAQGKDWSNSISTLLLGTKRLDKFMRALSETP